ARGVPAVRLTERLAVVANEKDIDYRHFRLTGTRDYLQPPERCVDIEADGVTLSVDLARSDLLLESELLRFAEPVSQPPPPGRHAPADREPPRTDRACGRGGACRAAVGALARTRPARLARGIKGAGTIQRRKHSV